MYAIRSYYATDRKDLIRQYKESTRPMGVGVVRNTSNGKCYVFAGRVYDLMAFRTDEPQYLALAERALTRAMVV